ncbi:hypothetical protein C8J57DRAFT_1227914 [Mycena rebaudengoi]|nr:hypothetical protein C8J57DRAFT_1227914 [Mycena rebaudengoi]
MPDVSLQYLGISAFSFLYFCFLVLDPGPDKSEASASRSSHRVFGLFTIAPEELRPEVQNPPYHRILHYSKLNSDLLYQFLTMCRWRQSSVNPSGASSAPNILTTVSLRTAHEAVLNIVSSRSSTVLFGMYRRQEVALELNSTGEPCSRTYIADRHGLVITLNAVEFSFVGFVSTWNMNNWPGVVYTHARVLPPHCVTSHKEYAYSPSALTEREGPRAGRKKHITPAQDSPRHGAPTNKNERRHVQGRLASRNPIGSLRCPKLTRVLWALRRMGMHKNHFPASHADTAVRENVTPATGFGHPPSALRRDQMDPFAPASQASRKARVHLSRTQGARRHGAAENAQNETQPTMTARGSRDGTHKHARRAVCASRDENAKGDASVAKRVRLRVQEQTHIHFESREKPTPGCFEKRAGVGVSGTPPWTSLFSNDITDCGARGGRTDRTARRSKKMDHVPRRDREQYGTSGDAEEEGKKAKTPNFEKKEQDSRGTRDMMLDVRKARKKGKTETENSCKDRTYLLVRNIVRYLCFARMFFVPAHRVRARCALRIGVSTVATSASAVSEDGREEGRRPRTEGGRE